MPVDLTETLVIGISSRALFDLEHENRIFEEQGLEAYRAYQLQHEGAPPRPGTAFHLVEAILKLNDYQEPGKPPLVEVVILSRNDATIGLRIVNAIKEFMQAAVRPITFADERLTSVRSGLSKMLPGCVPVSVVSG